MTTLVLLIALAFAMIVTPFVRQLALRINFVDVPKSDRAHRVTTPMMGGVALYIGLICALLLLMGVLFIWQPVESDNTFTYVEMLAVLVGGTAMAAIGLWDDWRPLPPPLKLLLQFVPVLILVLTTDIRINMQIPDIVNLGLSVCWFLYLINAFNYTDNLDGVAAMIATVAGMFFMVIAVINQQFLLGALAAAVAGTSFAFLRYNLFGAAQKIFMGDVGALFLGFLLAAIGVKLTFAVESPWVTWPVPVLVLGVPIFDTAMVFISRFRRGVSFLHGGTDHLSHRLKRLGFGQYGVPFAIGLMSAALGCLAIIVMHSTLLNSLATQVMLGLFALYILVKLEFTASEAFITGAPNTAQTTPPDAGKEEPIAEKLP